MNKTILYIGNNLNYGKNKNFTTMETLSNLLEKEGFYIKKSSNKNNKFARLLDMVVAVIKNKTVIDYLLIDTFSTSNFYYAFIISQLARFYKIRYIPILHGGNLPERLLKSKRKSTLIFENAYINIAPSNYLKIQFEEKGYKVVLIPNIINTQAYNFKQREFLKPKILYVRAFAKIYNPTMAIEVLKKLKEKYTEAVLCMIGPDRDGSFREVQDLAKHYDLLDSVEFTGVLSKKDWHWKSKDFDVFINTTNIDNTPVSVIEAMALGLTIVSTNVGGIPYLIEDGIDGVLVEKNNVLAMVNAIDLVLKNNNLMMNKNAKKKASSFSWEIVKHEWFKILK
jgi:glycosyltransferase involved in cell wall biosynthesis